MRRMMTSAAVVALAVGLLTGCTSGPNQEAVKAAAEYSEELTAWAEELTAATAKARTGTSEEWAALPDGVEELPFAEVGIGEALKNAPALKEFDEGAVENTPTYLAAAAVEEQVGVIVEELAGLEPESLLTLRLASFHSYWPLADLYYNTLGGPAADRVNASTDSLDYVSDDPAKYYEINRTAGAAFAEERLDLLGVAVTALEGVALGDEETEIIPESALGASVGAFILDWLHEEEAFQKDAVEELESWKAIGDPYNSYWNYGNLNSVFEAPLQYASSLRPAFAAQVADLSATLADATKASPAPSAPPDLASIGDPYRQALIDGYLPWGDPAETQERTADRLWLLWRIRELESTPDAAYAQARSAVLEEFNRSIEEGEGEDFRPGATRMLLIVEEYTGAFEPGFDAAENERTLALLKEIVAYGERIRTYPLLPEVAADFDALLALLAEANDDVADALEANPDEDDQYDALADLSDEYADKIFETVSPSAGMLDDDAQVQALIADAVAATAPGAASASPSPAPSP